MNRRIALAGTVTVVLMLTPLIEIRAQQTVLEEVVVTARKREENVQGVAISVSVLGAAALRDMRITDLSDISSLMPNVVASGGGQSSSTFSIRGVSTTANNPGFESGIGLYVDEVYIGKSFAFITPTAGIERIEVLRGPQGTLFGRNTIGGAINVLTQAPPEHFKADVRLGLAVCRTGVLVELENG